MYCPKQFNMDGMFSRLFLASNHPVCIFKPNIPPTFSYLFTYEVNEVNFDGDEMQFTIYCNHTFAIKTPSSISLNSIYTIELVLEPAKTYCYTKHSAYMNVSIVFIEHISPALPQLERAICLM